MRPSPIPAQKELPRRTAIWITLAGLALVFAVFLPFVGNGFLYDDFALILEPPAITSVGDTVELLSRPFYPTLVYYRPIASATYLIQRGSPAGTPAGFHLVNVLLAGGLFLATAALLKRPGFGLGPRPAIVCALLFAIHPVTSSCVHPVSGRDTLLVALWVVGTVNAFSRRGPLAYGVGVSLFAVALLTKESAVMLPGLVLVADLAGITEAGPPPSIRGWTRRYLPLGLLLAGYFAVRSLLFADAGTSGGALADVPLAYLYSAQVALVPFVRLLYEPSVAGWWSWWRSGLVIAFVVLVVLELRNRDARARRRAAFWSAWFVITLIPSANLLAQETRFAERYSFLPALAPLALATMLVGSATRERVRRAAPALAAILVLLYAGITLSRGPSWSDEAFYRAWIRHDPGRITAYYNLATLLARTGRVEESIPWYEQAAAIQPGRGDVRNNLGAALVRLERFDEALPHLQAAVQINPTNFQAQNNLAAELGRRGETDEAIDHYREALRLRPEEIEIRRDLARTLAGAGEMAAALKEFQGVARLDPDNPRARNNLGTVLAMLGRLDEATAEFERAVALDPGYPGAWVNLGHALVARNAFEDAADRFAEALRLQPGYADAHYGLATALVGLGRRDEARQSLGEALRLDPGHVNARNLLAREETP